jgi:hypothetical protein
MGKYLREIAGIFAIAVLLFCSSCSQPADQTATTVEAEASTPVVASPQPEASPSPAMPNLQAEILDERNKTTTSPLSTFDFKNFSYPLPRGWQHPDGSDVTLTNGKLDPVRQFASEDMSDEEKAAAKAERRIGMSYVTTKFMDVTGDGQDDAIVVLKIETAGSAIPQIAYVYEWKDGKPELIWYFRTGDRADGGLKDIRVENGEVVVELYGQDRFLLGETETGKITGDEEQLCCPTYFTRTRYKWNGRNFLMQKKRLTYSVADLAVPPLENYGDIVNAKEKSGSKR